MAIRSPLTMRGLGDYLVGVAIGVLSFVLGRLANLLDAVITGRPPRIIDRQFGWLREIGYRVAESGWSGMSLYVTYASKHLLVRVREDYHYEWVGVWLARAGSGETGGNGPDVKLEQLLASRAPGVRWDGSYYADTFDREAREAKLAEAAGLIRVHFDDLLRGENLDALGPSALPPSGDPRHPAQGE